MIIIIVYKTIWSWSRRIRSRRAGGYVHVRRKLLRKIIKQMVTFCHLVDECTTKNCEKHNRRLIHILFPSLQCKNQKYTLSSRFKLITFLSNRKIIFSLFSVILDDAKHFVASFGHSCPLSKRFQEPVGDDYSICFLICSSAFNTTVGTI